MRMLSPLLYDDVVRRALAEDLATAGDLTTDAIVPESMAGRATFVSRAAGRVAGLDAALHALRVLDPSLQVEVLRGDGADVQPGDAIARVAGRARALLTGERTALNLLCRLSGIATATREAVAATAGTRARVACTRKTTPGLRALEKYAVRVGGGVNHRFGLHDAVLIKDNHVALAGGVAAAIRLARAGVGHMVRIEVEVDTLEQLDAALAEGADAVLLDNMTPDQLRLAVARVGGRALTEASGGLTPATLRAVAEAGVDLISLGWLTHSAPSLDIGLDVDTATPEAR